MGTLFNNRTHTGRVTQIVSRPPLPDPKAKAHSFSRDSASVPCTSYCVAKFSCTVASILTSLMADSSLVSIIAALANSGARDLQWPHHGASVNVPNTVGFSRHKQCQLTHVPKRLGDIYEWFDGTVGSRWNAVERTEVDEHHLVVREDVIEVVLRTNQHPVLGLGFPAGRQEAWIVFSYGEDGRRGIGHITDQACHKGREGGYKIQEDGDQLCRQCTSAGMGYIYQEGLGVHLTQPAPL